MGNRRSASQAPISFRSSRHAKRARAAAHSGSTTDWADLGDGPAGLIADRVLADDVVGYILFRAVCRSWRGCCDDPLTRGGGVLEDPRFRPRQWIMLLGEKEKLDVAGAPHRCRRQFLNVSTGKCIQVEVPELGDHGVIRSTTAEGLLFLHCKATGAVRLLHPLTRQTAELPPVTAPRKIYPGYTRAGLADDHTAFLYSFGEMAFAKPGDELWVLLANNTHMPMPNVFFAGRIYGFTNRSIMTVDMNRGQVVVVVKLDKRFDRWVDTGVHLVDNGGKLVLVHRTTSQSWRQRSYKVYRVDLEAGKVTTRGGVGLSLGGRAIFLARCHSISVSPQAFPFIEANTVYPGLSLSERARAGSEQIGSYRIRDGKTESFSSDSQNPLPHPWSIADCLAAYVSAYDA